MHPSSSMLVAIDSDVEVIQHVLISRYFTAAAVVILLYDALLTLKEEVRLIWPGALTFPKLLYYINRYMAICFLIGANFIVAGLRPPMSDTGCQYWVLATGPAQTIASIVSTVILCLRVAALYNDNTWVLRCLWTFFGITAILTTTVGVLTIVALFKGLVYNQLVGVCLPSDISYKTYAIFAIYIVFDLVIISLTTFKTYRHVRRESGALVLYTLFRDGLAYFLIIGALRIWNSVVWLVLPPSYLYLATFFDWALLSTLTSRFFLNLRSVVYDNRVDGQSQATTVMALDDIRLTTWEFLRRRPQKSRIDIDTNAIVMDFRVERGVTVTEVSQVRQGDTSGTETQRRRSGSDRRSL